MTRNSEVLASFVAYCTAHPSERFYQALLNWSKVPFILVSNVPTYEVHLENARLIDPYNWEGRNEL
jgi:hypothetical protein